MNSTFAILVVIDLVNSTKFFERVGDRRASEAMRVYDRIFRGLLIKYSGIEIDKTDGALLLFETMKEALTYTVEYHKMVEKHIGLKSRVGIHCGVVMMHSNSDVFVSRGAKPIEVDGIHKNITARVMSLAGGGQTLLSKKAGEYAMSRSVRGRLHMADVGTWKMKGVKAPMQLYAISDDYNNLKKPKATDKVKLVKPPRLSDREKRRRFIRVFIFYPLLVYSIYFYMCVFSVLEGFNYIDRWGFTEAVRLIHSIPENIEKLIDFLSDLETK